MGAFIDMKGWKMSEHGHPDSQIVVIERMPYRNENDKRIRWKCQCLKCGRIFIANGDQLRKGQKTCGCAKADRARELVKTRPSQLEDMTGWIMSEHGVPNSYIKVIRRAEDLVQPSGRKKPQWLCECLRCGTQFVVLGQNIKKEHTLSCGCYSKVAGPMALRRTGASEMTKGEKAISDILEKEGIKALHEHSFEDLREGTLRYDFYLPEKNILIEFDGKQHFQYVECFHHSQQGYEKSQQRDKEKNKYAIIKGIKLYRIPYYELNNIQNFEDITSEQFLIKEV